MTDRAIMVWGEIPVTNLEKAVAFYSEVFGYKMTINNSGPNPMADLGGQQSTAGAHLYPGCGTALCRSSGGRHALGVGPTGARAAAVAHHAGAF